ncbi:MAG TPA: hypothetical protein EYP08_00740 [Pyrodictiaceae archaeon]|nr:hypothetical protein [Pyrodictiaceae archaeon]HIQ55609.1 hypothetical protein [Pyrodictium sp.]
MSNYKPSRVVAVVAMVDGRIDPRTSIAYSSFSQVAVAMGVDISRIEIEVSDIYEAVTKLRSVMKELSTDLPLIIDLGGGMRVLLIETLLAYFSLPNSIRKSIKLVVYFEGTNRSVELSAEDISEIMAPKRVVLKPVEKEILEILESGTYSLSELYTKLRQRGYTFTKQYLHKILQNLIEQDLVERVSRGYYTKKRSYYSP